MPRKAKPHKTFHISVPDEDTEILEWLSKQYNQSSSVRQLIREAARDVGMVDLFIGTPAARTPGVRGAAKQPARVEAERAQAQAVPPQPVTAQLQETVTQPVQPVVQQPLQQHPQQPATPQQQPSQSAHAETATATTSESTQPTPAAANPAPKKKVATPARKPKKKTSAGIQMDVSILDDALGSTSSIKRDSSLDKTMEEVDNMDKDAVDILKDLMDL